MSGDNLTSTNDAGLDGEQQVLSLSSSKSLDLVGAASLAGPQTTSNSARPKTILGFALYYEDKDGNRVRDALDDTDDIGTDIAPGLPNRVFRRATSPVVSILRLSSSVISELPPKKINTPNQAVLSSPVMSRRHAVIEFMGDNRVVVKDLGSLHGTYITRSADEIGSRIIPHEPYDLKDGDLVTFGRPVNRSIKNTQRRVEPARVRIRFLYEPESQEEATPPLAPSEVIEVPDNAPAAASSSVVLSMPPIRYLSESPSPSPSPSSDDKDIPNRVPSNRYGVFEVSRSPSPSSSVEMDEEDYPEEDLGTASSTPNTSPESRRHCISGNIEDAIPNLPRRLPSIRHLGLLNGGIFPALTEQSSALVSLLSRMPTSPQLPPVQWAAPSGPIRQEDDGASRLSSPMHLSSHEGTPEPVVVGAWPNSPHARAESPRSVIRERSRSPSVMELIPAPSPVPDPRSPLLRPSTMIEDSLLNDDDDDDDVVEIPGPSLLVIEDFMAQGFSPERFNIPPDLLIDPVPAPPDHDREREVSPVLSWLEKIPEQSVAQTSDQDRNKEIQQKLNDIHDGLKSFTKDRADIQATVKALHVICDNKFAFLERQGREILQAQERNGDEHANALARNILDLQSLQDMEQHAKDLISALSLRTADISHKLHSMANRVDSGIKDNSTQIEALRELQSDFIKGFSSEIENIVTRLLAVAARPQPLSAPVPVAPVPAAVPPVNNDLQNYAEVRRTELPSTAAGKRKRDEYEEEYFNYKELEAELAHNQLAHPDAVPELPLPPSKRARVSSAVNSALSFTGIASFGALAMWLALAYY